MKKLALCFYLFGFAVQAISMPLEGRYSCMISKLEIKHIAPKLLEIKDLIGATSYLAFESGPNSFTRLSGKDSMQIRYQWISDKEFELRDMRDSIPLRYKLEKSIRHSYVLTSEPYGSNFVKTQVEAGFLHYYNAVSEDLSGHVLKAARLYARAITKLEVAYNSGYPNAHLCLLLGRCYSEAKGTTQQYAKALVYYARALKYAEAQWACARMYDVGDNTLSKDWEKAAMCYKLCAKQTQDPYIKAEAHLILGEFYLLGVGGMERNDTLAQQHFEKGKSSYMSYKKRLGAVSNSKQLLTSATLNRAKGYKGGGLDVKLGYDLLKPRKLEKGKEALLFRVNFAIPDNAEAVRVLPVFYGPDDPEQDFISGFDYSPSPLYISNGQHKLTVYMKEDEARFVGQLYIGLYVYERETDEKAAYVIPVKVPFQAAWVDEKS